MGCHWYLPYITNIAPNWPIIGNIFAISTENTNKKTKKTDRRQHKKTSIENERYYNSRLQIKYETYVLLEIS